MIRHYELGLVINPDLAEDQIEAQVLRVGQAIEAREGKITHLDKWGRRRLAYPIEHHREGYYAFIDMEMDTTAVREIESMLRVQENVMRHLITMIDPRTLEERRRRQEQDAARAAAQAAQAAQRAAEQAAAQEAQAEQANEPAPADDAAQPGNSAPPALSPAEPAEKPAAPVTDESASEA